MIQSICTLDWELVIPAAQALAMFLGVWVAWCGLQTWRAQLKGTREYELALAILRDAYKMRYAFAHFRSNLRNINVDLSREFAQERFDAETKDWDERSKVVFEALESLKVQALEAEVVFGDKEITECAEEFYKIYAKIWYVVKEHLRYKNPKFSGHYGEEMMIQHHRVLFRGEEEDPIEPQISALIVKIENHLKPYLQRK